MVDLRTKSLADRLVPAEPDVFALAQLIQGHLAVLVVNRYGEHVTDTGARRFWDEQRPNFSKALTDAVAGESEAVIMAAFAKPEYAMSLIESTFDLREPQPDETGYVFRVLRQVKAKPADIRKIARKEQLRLDELWIGPDELRTAKPLESGVDEPFGSDEKAMASDLFSRFRYVKAGAVFERPILTPDSFQIFRVEERRPDEIRVVVVTLPKPTIDDWFWKQVRDIPVEISDELLREKFVSSIPWARMLRSREGFYPPQSFNARAPGPWRDL